MNKTVLKALRAIVRPSITMSGVITYIGITLLITGTIAAWLFTAML